ncbi:MAG: hypothetical protein PHG23_01560 [Candidatus Pacebacteria bacterium]|nr:hypothetical protein [Candidatus Paceibacterota bacterium]
MKKIFLGVLVALFAVSPFLVFGATTAASENYYLSQSSVVNDNLYVAGSDVNVAGSVLGDLLAAGGNMFISGPVGGDLMLVGGTLNIISKVSGDVRVAGGNIMISNSVGGDLLAAGGQVNVLEGLSAGKDVKIAGGNVNFSGTAAGSMEVAGDQVYINGTVEKDLVVRAADITFGPKAVIRGNFDYYSPKEAVMEQGSAISGQTNFHKTAAPLKKETAKGFAWGFITLAWLLKSAMIILAGLVAIYVFKGPTQAVVEEALGKFWSNAGKGFGLLFLIPIAVILSFITVVASFLGLIALFAYIALLIASSIIAVLVFARLALKYIFKKEQYELNWWIVIIAALVLGAVSLIPFVGWLFTFVVFLAAFGSLTSYVFGKIKQ